MPIPATFRSSMKKLNEARLTSKGHAAGRFASDLWANEEGAKAYVAERGDVAAGATLIVEHFETVRGETVPGPVMMMTKLARATDPTRGDWAFTVQDSKGALLDDSDTALCAGCHEAAPHDYVFHVYDVK
ncbi:MAG: cytochrome P460 family protein [Polyangiaceae bacterium]